ncbi:hypothetical protein WA1_05055 [Scytonema hofmannii PCC 7110]|uniref:Uncharacterized protein n=1 Tax=Scytonema hofmannii PCC 7110 TaxID=128403 RepID=A0A139WZJ1_9CYAN|nr:T3SS effector HopA1 family protein [Scytonema hofmannii]KYC37874.1 hypothetical protein WA1_05055 [Scytonema hofmannii PCC 7110]
MQLLGALPNQLLSPISDIVSKVQIQANFCIIHPDYNPLELSAEVVASLQQLPTEIQNKYLNLQLRTFLYGIYYNGDLKETLAMSTNSDSLESEENLENNTIRGLNRDFYEGLQKSNCGKGYFDLGWRVLRQESDDLLAVQKDNLTLHVERVSVDYSQEARYPQFTQQSATVGDIVAIKMPSNLLEQEFYVAVGDAGLMDSCEEEATQTVNIYFNFSSEGALAVMKSLTQQLNEMSIPFTFKVLYDPDKYYRYDCGVLQFQRHNYQLVHQVLQSISIENKCHFRNQLPLFTKPLTPGLSLAEEPDCKFAAQEDFGMNRCRIIANALLEAWHKGDNSEQGRMNCIHKHFSQLGIGLQHPYLNANSEDIYLPL